MFEISQYKNNCYGTGNNSGGSWIFECVDVKSTISILSTGGGIPTFMCNTCKLTKCDQLFFSVENSHHWALAKIVSYLAARAREQGFDSGYSIGLQWVGWV